MNHPLIAILLLISGQVFAQDIINDPKVSKRCIDLIQNRNEKIVIQQKLNAILAKNSKLITQLKPNQNSVKQRLELNRTDIKNHLRLSKMKVRSMEENIIRKGCPGITL